MPSMHGEGISHESNGMQLNTTQSALEEENQILKNEAQKLRELLEKKDKDLQRLRNHLVETNDAHTLYGINKENQIALLEQQLQDYQNKEEKVFRNIQLENRSVKEQLNEKNREIERLSTALMNLQSVLEHFQAEQEAQVNAEVQLLRTEIEKAKQEVQKKTREAAEVKAAAQRCEQAEKTVRELQEELSNKTRAYVKLQEEFEPMRKNFEQTMKRLTNFTTNEQHIVDKRLIAKLLVTYFSGTANKNDVLQLMANILNLNTEQRQQIGLIKPSKWFFSSLFGGNNDNNKEPGPDMKNLMDMWVSFLLKEASEMEQLQEENENSSVP